jgi:alpha-L-fucosidase
MAKARAAPIWFALLSFCCYTTVYWAEGLKSGSSGTINKPIGPWQELDIGFDEGDLGDEDAWNENRPKPESDIHRYLPTWDSLDARPLPNWYDSAKIGIFIHWGVFSVPAYNGAWFWNSWVTGSKTHVDFMKENYPPRFTYQDFGPQFTAEFYDPNKWANLFQKAGAKYVVLTSKHHEGFTMWPSKYSFGWSARDVGPKRDLLGDLANAIRANTTLKFGLYHSLYEWYNPLYLADAKNNYTTDLFVTSKTMPELYELVNTYKPEIVWSDGDWDAPAEYWKSQEFIAWLYNDSPVKETVVTNDRWGRGVMCKHGGYMTCSDRYNPGVLIPKKWENCMTLDRDWWANRRNAQIEDFLTPEELLKTVVETVACGGNILINVGPTKEGVIIPVQEERLLQLGAWLGVNGEAIYETKPWTHQNDTVTPDVWYTTRQSEKKIYATMLKWPGAKISLGAMKHNYVQSIQLLGTPGHLKWAQAQEGNGIVVLMPELEMTQSRYAWTLLIRAK